MKHFLLTIFFATFATAAFAQAEQTMYWIGGAGNWSDLSHWSYRSGTQDPDDQPSSVPTANTHVIIDGSSGLTSTQAASRTITVNVAASIKSLTFTAGSNNARLNISQTLRVTGDITLQQNTAISAVNSLYLAMEPPAGTTSTLTTNGNKLDFNLGKNGLGTTDIVGDNINTKILQVFGGTLNFEGTDWLCTGMQVVNDGTVVNMPNITTYNSTGATYIGGTKSVYGTGTSVTASSTNNVQLNIPLVKNFTSTGGLYLYSPSGLTLPECTTFTGGTITVNDPSFLSMPVCTSMNGGTFTLSSTTAHSFPALETLTVSTMAAGNASGSLALGTGGTTVTCSTGWQYSGTLTNADKAEFHFTYTGTTDGTSSNYARFTTTKSGLHIKKMVFENAHANAYLSMPAGIIDELTFTAQGATIAQSMTIGTLSVAPSAAYSIEAGKIITLTEDLVDNTPDCETFWQLTGKNGSIETLRNSTGHDIALTNVQITHLKADGANAITAAGIDNGGNENITFVAPAPKTLYWVGKGGDNQWHTLENWARTSGGTDHCMPTQYDDIVFDQNSVITAAAITITDADAYFHDITIGDDCPKAAFSILTYPAHTAASPAMYCYGSWYMKTGVSVHPRVYFISTDRSETITSNTSTFSNIYLANTGGWTLADNLKTIRYGTSHEGVLYHLNGKLDTNGHTVDLANGFDGNASVTTYLPASGLAYSYRSLVLGSSEITLRGQDVTTFAWKFGSSAKDTLNAGTSTIVFDPATPATTTISTFQAYSASTNNVATVSQTVIDEHNTRGTLRYHNIVFKGTVEKQITATGYVYQNMPLEANSLRMENAATLKFITKWVKLDSLYAAPLSTVWLPSPASASSTTQPGTGGLIINESMQIPTSDCTDFSTMRPYTAGYQATIYSAVDIHIPNVQMTNVKAEATGSGNTFTASGIDDGGNEGWIFTERSAKDLYWTGAAGDGKWNTPENWTANADGTPDGGCVPIAMDNVYFNEHSVLPANNTITVEGIAAAFNNFVAEAGTPAGIIIHQNAVQINAYGSLFQTGENMQFRSSSTNTDQSTSDVDYVVNLLGSETDARLVNGAGSAFAALTVNNAAARWTFLNNMTMKDRLKIEAVTELTLDMDKFTGYAITHSTGIVNMADSINLSKSDGYSPYYAYTMAAGTLNADNTVWNMKNGFYSTSGTRTLNIRNAQIGITGSNSSYSSWNYSGTGATLNAEDSHIKVALGFAGLNGQQYGTVETDGGSSTNIITGNLSFRELILNNSRQISGSNAVDTLLLRPKGSTLYLANGTTQTVNNLMQLSGSPCLQNTLRAGTSATESGSTQSTATASIDYRNAAGVNVWDQIAVGGILATGDSLKFEGNSSDYGLNNDKVIFFGEPGVTGLPDAAGLACFPVDTIANPKAYILSAREFFGTDLSTYTWYRRKADGKSWEKLTVPSGAVEIDTRQFGMDGTYRVEVVYDSTAVTACKSVDETTVTYQAPVITFADGEDTTTDLTWAYCETNTFRVSDLLSRMDSISQEYTKTALFDTIRVFDALSGGNLLEDTLTLTNGGDYYLEFVTDNSCTPSMRSHITVVIDAMPAADAGPNQSGNPLNPFTMAATATGGTGVWTLVSGDAAIADPASPTTTVQLVNGSKQAVLRWTVTNGSCESSDLVTVGKSSVVPRANPGMRVRVQ